MEICLVNIILDLTLSVKMYSLQLQDSTPSTNDKNKFNYIYK